MDRKTSPRSLIVLFAALAVSCGPDIREGAEARVAFAEGYTSVSQAKGPKCTMTTEGGGARRARLACPEVEPETVVAMVEAVCEPMGRVGFKRVEYSSEAGAGRCVVSRCSCKETSEAAQAPAKAKADASVADGGP